MDFHLTSLITTFTLILLFGVAFNVGKARAKYKIDAPATTGHPKFELVYRVQMNTVENAVVFIPAQRIFFVIIWDHIFCADCLINRTYDIFQTDHEIHT